MEALSSEEGITDDASILEKAGVPVTVLPGKEQFFKVTTPGDWSRFTKMIEKEGLPFRIGQGYDIHRYDESRPLMLGGVEIAKTGGLLGHSDADVLLHAIMDALLGAAGLPDGNIDSTVIAEKPKLAPHIAEMKASIAHLLGISENQVGVKATTNEKLGAVGRREGMAALASVIIYRK